ncbi:hypothetical protein ABB29_08060 [Pseudoxanthomonas dokdonensis]|uniref:Uncharacterized protein n=1 Tax=Pseudoxanthomonas dokdonensis TaxID=344882 RepID=A0A0R0CJT2_9GAMM|nr:hypothetical protein ABB29_08060 [Pseudoxanthomonas dokdonensis]
MAACSASRNDSDSAADEPLRKLNPNPQQAYRITLTIQDAPGPLLLTDARAQYDVSNETPCGKMKPQGGPYRMTSSEPLELTRIDETTYQGTVYLDRIVDADYYGKGVCHWALSIVYANFKATGKPEETTFEPSLVAEKVIAQQSQTRYFWNGSYPRGSIDGSINLGQTDSNRINYPDEQKFTITVSSEQVHP